MLIAERILASYAILHHQYLGMLTELMEEYCNWDRVHAYAQQSTGCIQRVADTQVEELETAQIKQCEEAAQTCLALHKRIIAALSMRKNNTTKEAAHAQRVSKALDAYRPNSQRTACYQDRHL